MLQFLLDTDHVTLCEMPSTALLQKLQQHAGTFGVSAVSVEESLRGRLAHIAQARDGPQRIYRYSLLLLTLQVLCPLPKVPFDQPSEDEFQRLRSMRLRVGTQDLKIAAIALANKLTLVTRNRQDFTRIPGIVLDDWSV